MEMVATMDRPFFGTLDYAIVSGVVVATIACWTLPPLLRGLRRMAAVTRAIWNELD